jgi:predicted membrane protein (TIGR00267 family)
VRKFYKAFGRIGLLPGVLGFTDGILTALTLVAGRLTNAEHPVSLGLALRVAAAALVSGAFVFFVARYAELREELVDAERQLNLNSRGRFASGRLGAAVLREGLASSMVSSFASFCGALVPLLAGALFSHHRWASILAAEVALALLGGGLARAVHGGWVRWSAGLIFGGLILSAIGAYLKLV